MSSMGRRRSVLLSSTAVLFVAALLTSSVKADDYNFYGDVPQQQHHHHQSHEDFYQGGAAGGGGQSAEFGHHEVPPHESIGYDSYETEDGSVAVDGDNVGSGPSLAGFMEYISNGVSSGIRRVRDFMQPVLGFGRRRSDTRDRTHIYFDVEIDGQYAGRINLELFDEVVPRTVENFRSIATGQNQFGYTFKGTRFHRVIPGFMIQGGDFENGDGTGGASIYGQRFADENFKIRHRSPGLLSMANAGKDTNGSQFFITTVKTEWLDGKHVVFGRVADQQSWDLVKTIESYGSAPDGKTSANIVIADSGEL